MASELENWWSKSYGLHSIRDLQALPVFSRFKAQHYPYDRSDDTVSESFKVEGPLDTFEWSDKGRQEGELFSHDRLKDEWTYEHRFQEPECKTTVKATLKKGEESGSINRVFTTHETSESWKLNDKTRWYETFTLQNGEKNGMRVGQLPATDGQENWIEKFFEKEGQSNFEKTWERPGAKGGENKQRKGDLWWGEVWHAAGDDTEKKMWHIQGDKDWGHTHGESCGKVWDEKWEIEDEKRSEEKIIQDGDRKRGFRYVRNGRDWYKQEWDGLKVQGLDEEAEKTQLARFRGTVDEIGVVEYDSTLKGEHTLQLLLRDVPHFAGEVEALKQERLGYPAPDREDINSLLEAERFFGALNDKQERLKQRMIEGRHSDLELYLSLHVRLEQALTESLTTLQEIGKIVANNPEAQDLSDWTKRVDEAKNKPFKSYYGKAQTLLELIERIEAEKRNQLKNLVDKNEINQAMDTLYQVMVKHDAVSDKIIELAPDLELKKKLDGFEDQFEEIHRNYQEEADPKRLHENLELLLAYQPIHLYLVGRLRGYNKDEVTHELGTIKDAMDETKTAPSLKNTRAKVRSGRGPKDTPFQLVDRALNRLLPFFVKTINTVRGDKSTNEKLEALTGKNIDGGEPFEIIIQKATAFAEAAEAHAPQVDALEEKLTASDAKLDALLEKNSEELKAIGKNPELLAALQELLARHYPQENMDLQLAKEDAVTSSLAQLADELKAVKDALKAKEDELKAKDDALKALQDALKAKEDELKALQDALKAKEDELKAVQDALKAVQDALKAKEDELKAVQDALKAKEDELKAVQDALKAVQDALKAKEDELKAVQDALKAKEDELKAVQDALKAKEAELKAKEDELKAKGDDSKAAVKEAMDTLYKVLVQNDAVSDKLIEVAPNAELKAKLDNFENQFEDIQKSVEEGDPKKLQESLNLLLAFQPIQLHLAGRVRGYVPDEVTDELRHIDAAVAETKDAPSLKSTRTKVRSARPARDTPAQLMDRALNRLLPFFATTISTVRGDKDAAPKLQALTSRTVDSGEPFEIVIQKAIAFAEAAETHTPQVDTLEAKITTSDQKLDVLLTKNCSAIEAIGKAPELLSTMKALLERHYPQENMDLELAKEEAVDTATDQIAEEAKAGGIALRDAVSRAMETLYLIMVKNDAVSDKLIELAPDQKLKTELDGFEDQFEDIHKKFEEGADPKKLQENLDLLLAYQPIHLHLVGRLRGYNPDEVTGELGAITTAVDETKGAPSLKSTRTKVRSGRGTKDTPFQLVDRALNRLLPFFVKTIKTVRGDVDTPPKLESLAGKSIDSGEPFEIIIEKANAFADAAEAHTAHVDDLEEKLTASDEKLDALLEKNCSVLEALERNPELLSTLQGLLDRHYPDEKIDLQLEKEDLVDAALEEMIAQINEMTETIETTTTESTNYQALIEEKANEIYSLKKMLEEKEKKLKQLDIDLEDARKYKPLYEARDNECAELKIRQKKVEMDLSDAQMQVTSLAAEVERLTKEVHELQEFKVRALDFQRENERLQGIIKNYEELMGDKKEQFEEVIGRLNKTISDKDSELEALRAEIKKLKEEVEAKENDRRKQLMLRVIFSMSNTLKAERLSTFLTWKASAEHEPEVLSTDYQVNIPELKSTVPTDEQEWTDTELAKFTEAEKSVFPIREELLRTNVIFRHMRTNMIAFQQPIAVVDFYKLMNELLLKKADVDAEDFGNNRRPANFPEFVFESLLRTRGAKHLAQQELARLVPRLHDQFAHGHPYAVLLARLLHMFHHSPAPLEGLVLVTRYNKLFVPLLQNCPQPKQEVEAAISGGEALLNDVLDQFYEQVGPEPVYQRALLRHLLPAEGVTLGYLLSLVKWSLAKKGKNTDEFWGWANAGGSATPDSLVAAVTQNLGLNVSPRLIKEACGNKPVEKATFDSVLASLKPADYRVTKGGFLMGILEGFFHKARRNVVDIVEGFAAEGAANLSKDQFAAAVHKLKADVPDDLITKMYDYGSKHCKGAPLDLVGFTRVLLRSLLGKLEVPALTVPELHVLYDLHVFEFDLETGIKIVVTKTTTTKVTKTTVRVVKKAT